MSQLNPNNNYALDLRLFYKVGTWASFAMLTLIPIQIIIFISFPPPVTAEEYFMLFRVNWLLGLLSLDLLYIVNTVLIILMYLAFYASLKEVNKACMIIALTLGFIGVASYFPSNPAFEMLNLSNQYFSAETKTQSSLFLASGEAMLSIYKGTAFNVYYVLNAITLLLISILMLKSTHYSKTTAYFGLTAGIFMIIPSTAGTIGLIFSLASLIPWMVFTFLAARTFYRLGYLIE